MRNIIPYIDEAEVAIVEEYRGQQVVSWEECVSFGMDLRERKDEAQWRLGVLSLIVEKYYYDINDKKDEKFHGVIPRIQQLFSYEISVPLSSLQNYKSVATAFLSFIGELEIGKIPDRPYPKLSFGHLASVVVLSDEDKKKVLDLAEENNWPVTKTREEASKYKVKTEKDVFAESEGEDPKFIRRNYIKVDDERKILWLHRAYNGYEIRWI